jgi:hypothetical protein
VLGRDDPLAVDVQAGQAARVRAGGEHDRLAGVLLPAGLNRERPDQLALGGHIVDLRGADQALQALVQAGDDTVLVRVDPGHVDADELRLDAELLRFAGLVGDLTGVQQGLGRDATSVQAGAAELVLFDQDDRQAELRGAQGGRVAAAAAAQDDDVAAVGHG